jgi:hypothetical protein
MVASSLATFMPRGASRIPAKKGPAAARFEASTPLLQHDRCPTIDWITVPRPSAPTRPRTARARYSARGT